MQTINLSQMQVNMPVLYTPRTQLTSIFEGQPLQNKAQTSIKTRGPHLKVLGLGVVSPQLPI